MAAVSDLAHAAGATVVVDNVFGTPVFSKPLEFGADVVVYSATKHIDGQGRTLGGAVLGSRTSSTVRSRTSCGTPDPPCRRSTPGSWSRAWRPCRCASRSRLPRPRRRTGARGPPRVRRVVYPWLASHPQHDLARKQMLGGGTVVTFEVDGGKDEAFAVMNALRIVDISNNLGDAKSMVTHPATTTHRRLSPGPAAVGITDGTVRISVGLEDSLDLIDDLIAALG